jgi:FKBP-type peptidyl-prolyl cis-trans isomerase
MTVLMPVTSCNLNSRIDDLQEEENITIQDFLMKNDTLDFELKNSGLYYVDIEVGTGLQGEIHDTANIIYTAKFLDGTEFDSNVGIDTLKYILDDGSGLAGLTEGLLYMREGGKAQLLIPSSLGFGSYGITYQGYKGTVIIGGFTPLLFEVELLQIIKYSGKK